MSHQNINPRWSVRPPHHGELAAQPLNRQHPLLRDLVFWAEPLASPGGLTNLMTGEAGTRYGAVRADDSTYGAAYNYVRDPGNANSDRWVFPQVKAHTEWTLRFLINGSQRSGTYYSDTWEALSFVGSGGYIEVPYWHHQPYYSGGIRQAGWGTFSFGSLLGENEWWDVVLSYSDKTYSGTLYINGKPHDTHSEGSSFSGMWTPVLGSWSTGSDGFTGKLSTVQWWNRPLTPSEIWQLYAPQTRWSLLRGRSTKRWFTSAPTPSTTGFRLINGRQFRPGSLVA